MIVLDTNVVSETMRPSPDPRVITWLNQQDIATLYLTAVSLAELRFGIARLDDGRAKDDLLRRLGLMLERIFPDRILPFGTASALTFAERMAEARRNGLAVGFQDGMIAAIVAEKRFAIASRDTGPFVAMGVTVINPWDQQS